MTNDNINRRPADRSATERPERWVRVPKPEQLPPDVRDRAFTAVKDALLGKGDVEPAKSSEFYNYVVSVVARPLQARITELERARDEARRERDDALACIRDMVREGNALKARVAESELKAKDSVVLSKVTPQANGAGHG